MRRTSSAGFCLSPKLAALLVLRNRRKKFYGRQGRSPSLLPPGGGGGENSFSHTPLTPIMITLYSFSLFLHLPLPSLSPHTSLLPFLPPTPRGWWRLPLFLLTSLPTPIQTPQPLPPCFIGENRDVQKAYRRRNCQSSSFAMRRCFPIMLSYIAVLDQVLLLLVRCGASALTAQPLAAEILCWACSLRKAVVDRGLGRSNPVRSVRGIEQSWVSAVHHADVAFQRRHVLHLHRLRRVVHVSSYSPTASLQQPGIPRAQRILLVRDRCLMKGTQARPDTLDPITGSLGNRSRRGRSPPLGVEDLYKLKPIACTEDEAVCQLLTPASPPRSGRNGS